MQKFKGTTSSIIGDTTNNIKRWSWFNTKWCNSRCSRRRSCTKKVEGTNSRNNKQMRTNKFAKENLKVSLTNQNK